MANKGKDKELIKSGMPETMFSDVAASNARYSIDDVLSEFHYAILDLQKAGLSINSVEELNSINREGIKSQLTKDKEAYFKNMRFIPAGIRRQVNKEFEEMERTLLPLVDKLVFNRKRMPFKYKLNFKENYKTGELCFTFDEKEKEDYIRNAGTIKILPEYREYYNALSDFCKCFTKLQTEAERLQINKPDRNLLLDLMVFDKFTKEEITGEIKPLITNMEINPQKMFELIQSNRIRLQAADELER